MEMKDRLAEARMKHLTHLTIFVGLAGFVMMVAAAAFLIGLALGSST